MPVTAYLQLAVLQPHFTMALTSTRCPLIATGTKPFGGAVPSVRPVRVQRPSTICDAASLQFIKGVDESTVPEVTLKRNRTGTAGTAFFIFENPSIFQASSELGDITGGVGGETLLSWSRTCAREQGQIDSRAHSICSPTFLLQAKDSVQAAVCAHAALTNVHRVWHSALDAVSKCVCQTQTATSSVSVFTPA